MLQISNLTKSYGADTVLTNVLFGLAAGDRVGLVGRGVKMGYLAQEQEILDPHSTPYDSIRAVSEQMSQTDTRNFLHFFLFSGDEVFSPIATLSYGERARLMLALLVAQGCNFLLLDEPVNHLDIPGRERFEQALGQFPGTVLAGAGILIVQLRR